MTVVGWSRQRWVGHDGAPAPCCTSSGVLSLPLMMRPGRRTKIGTSHFGRSGHGPLSLGKGLEHLVASVGGAGARAGRLLARSEERRVGKECFRTFRSRWLPDT